MSNVPSTQRLVLQEFRLNTAESAALVAELVATPPGGIDAAGLVVPLLVSVDDRRDVATLRTVDADFDGSDLDQRTALSPFVASWRPLTWYEPRVVESAQAPPTYYRLAVTESGINDVGGESSASARRASPPARQAATPIALLWIAAPADTHAGLLVLVGHHGKAPVDPGTSRWPLPLSDMLGVRIYEGSTSKIGSRAESIAGHGRAN